MIKKNLLICLTAFLIVSGSLNLSFAIECINTKFLFDIKPNADQPSDVTVGPNGYIYLVDGVNNRIIVFNSRGKWKFSFGSWGRGQGQFKTPVGIDVSENKVFIADTGNHRIQVFDLQGKFLYMFKVKNGSNERPSDPVDVLASRIKNYLYVSDNDNHKIKLYKQDGTFETEWGKIGEGSGEFRYPGILARNEFNEIFVVDVLNTRVQKFDPFGKFIADIGSWGILPGNLFRPKGVAIDKDNRVFISDSYMGNVQVMTDLGRFIGIVCNKGKKRKFITPTGLFIDRKDKLYVVEMRENKVTVLKILD